MEFKTRNEVRDEEAEALASSAVPLPDGLVPLTDDNLKLHTLDEAVRELEADPEKQLGLLIVAMVLCVRRFCTGKGIFDRGRRLRVCKAAVGEFDKKLRTLVGKPPVTQN